MKNLPRPNRVADAGTKAKAYDAAMEVLRENAESIKVVGKETANLSKQLIVRIPPDDEARINEVTSALKAFAAHHGILRIVPHYHPDLGDKGVTCELMLDQYAGYEDYVAILARELANNGINYPGSSRHRKQAVGQ